MFLIIIQSISRHIIQKHNRNIIIHILSGKEHHVKAKVKDAMKNTYIVELGSNAKFFRNQQQILK